jgi:hypothetical protein
MYQNPPYTNWHSKHTQFPRNPRDKKLKPFFAEEKGREKK